MTPCIPAEVCSQKEHTIHACRLQRSSMAEFTHPLPPRFENVSTLYPFELNHSSREQGFWPVTGTLAVSSTDIRKRGLFLDQGLAGPRLDKAVPKRTALTAGKEGSTKPNEMGEAAKIQNSSRT